MYQRGDDLSGGLKSLAYDFLDIYDDQQDLVMGFKEAIQERDSEESGEILGIDALVLMN